MKRRIFLTLVLIVTLLPMAGLVNAAPMAQEEVTYTVQKDDNLWVLAEKYLGSGPAYRAIVMATNAKHEEDETFAQIVNPNIIQPGWKVLIPAPAEAEELVATAKPIIVLALDSDIDHVEPMEFRSDAGYYATANFYEPLLLQKLGVDPAVASSVFVTAMTDVVAFFLLFGLAAVLLLPSTLTWKSRISVAMA